MTPIQKIKVLRHCRTYTSHIFYAAQYELKSWWIKNFQYLRDIRPKQPRPRKKSIPLGPAQVWKQPMLPGRARGPGPRPRAGPGLLGEPGPVQSSIHS